MDTKLSTNRKFRRMFANILSIVVILALVFSVMGSAFAQETTPRVGLIANPGAIEDNGFNEMAYQGLLQAQAELGISTSLYHPGDQSEYDVVLQQCADENELCIAVGFDFRFSLAEAARANPDTKWGLVDWSYPDCWEGAVEGVDCGSFTEIPNVRGLRFNEKQVGYLAGVLAGDMTTSETIGAVGGMEIPQVVAFVEGYRNGAQCTNPDVTVLTTYTGTFSDPDLGATTAQEMIAQGADVIFGAAGATGNGAITYSAQHEQWAIGVDTDQYLTVFGGGTVAGSDKLLSSAMKRVNNAVYQTIGDYANGMFSPGTVNYDLAMDGVGLAPFHETDDSIPQEVKDNLETVRQGIIDGTVNIDDPCEPPPPPNPHFTIFPEWEFFDGLDWPDGAIVSISVEGKPVCNLERESWGGFFNGNFPEGCDVEIGDTVTFDDGTTNRTHVVRNLDVTAVDLDENTITGKADAGSVVYVWPHDAWFEPLQATANDLGVWQVDLDDAGYDILEGKAGRSEIRDEMGNATAVDWYYPVPHFTAFPEWDYLEGWDWLPNVPVYLSINPATSEEFHMQSITEPTPWDPNRWWVRFDLTGQYDLKAGDVVRLDDDAVERTMIIKNLSVTDADIVANTVGGKADFGAVVEIWPHETGQQLQATADEDGNWQVNFTDVPFDLVEGTCGRSQIVDGFGNATAVDWCAPKPWLIAFPENEAVEGWEWPEGTTVYLTIDNAPGLEWSGTAAVTTWGDPRTYVRFDFADAYDLKVGDIVMLTDGMTVRQHTVETLFVTDVDADKDEISGKAGGDETIYVWPHGAWFEPLQTTTHSITGNWQVDFTDAPFDLAPGMSGRSQILDEAGNATAVDWYAHPRYIGHWRAVDSYDQSNMQLTISGGGGNHYQLTWTDDYWSACRGPGIGRGTGTPNPGGFLRVNWVIQCQGAVVWEGQFDYFLDIVTGTLWDGANAWYLVGGQ